MISTTTRIEDLTLDITEEIRVRAPLQVTFAALLEQLGPFNETAQDKPMPMKLEAWPGGRWYRDLGDNNGHFWGVVQAIKRPTLLEITGPLFMSYPVVSNLQYRLSERDRWRNIARFSSHGAWTDFGRPPKRSRGGLETYP